MIFCTVTIRIECNNGQNDELSLRDIVKLILLDPEFLAMNDYDQLRVLDALYTIIESHLKQRMIEHKQYRNSLNQLRWKRSLEI